MCMTTNFLYENKEIIEELLKKLKEEKRFYNLNRETLDVYKFLYAIEMLNELEGTSKRLRQSERKICFLLEKEALRLNPSAHNLVFFEKVRLANDVLYFKEYVQKCIKSSLFLGRFWNFASERKATS